MENEGDNKDETVELHKLLVMGLLPIMTNGIFTNYKIIQSK